MVQIFPYNTIKSSSAFRRIDFQAKPPKSQYPIPTTKFTVGPSRNWTGSLNNCQPTFRRL